MNAQIIIITILAIFTLGVLGVGIFAMIKGGGKENGRFQNKMMTYRIWLQAAAIGLIVLLVSTK